MSSLENGSSSRSARGSDNSTRISTTQARWPSERVPGSRFSSFLHRDVSECGSCPLSPLRSSHALRNREHQVLDHRHVRKEQIILKQQPHAPRMRGERSDVLARHHDATRSGKGGRQKSRDIGKQRRFADPARAHDSENLAGADDRIEADERTVRTQDADILKDQILRLGVRAHRPALMPCRFLNRAAGTASASRNPAKGRAACTSA